MKHKGMYLVVIGAVLGYLSLSLNQLIPFQFSIASLLSPTGAQVTIAGLRIKHWVSGIFVAVLGFMSYKSSKNATLKDIGLVMVSFGAFLVFDEYTDVLRFITTGRYP
ncbi:MAG: hypothetical protein MUO43_12540 [Desulfobacterales bacterium]|nr:hypothetical protein [Desulfobacterales bacterium]